jgi:two-component system sensor histidine kinase HydH
MLPPQKISFKISRAALAIVVAALLLAALLATLTIRNIRREESLMQTFLLHEGLTLIRSFEAGARTTMMHHMGGEDPLTTLVQETVKEPSVAYIRVVYDNGEILASAGDWPDMMRPARGNIITSAKPLTTRVKGKSIFEIAAPFTPIAGGGGQGMMMGRWACGTNARDRGRTANGGQWAKWSQDNRKKIIYLGLHTGEFDKARHVDVRHALLLGGILFLVGFAGLYFIFLYQNMRVARRTLADMEIYTDNVIESMPAGLITLDTAGRVVSCNSRVEGITGKKNSELRGKILSGAIDAWPDLSPDEPPLVEQPFTCSHDDMEIPVRISTSVLHDGEGRVNGQVIIVRDVREIVDIEQKLEQSRRLSALGRMAAGIAHEIRNPLGTLRGFAQLFTAKFSNQPEERRYAEMMVEEVDRLNRTISALLQFARPREPEFGKVNINQLLQKNADFMAADFANQAIDFNLILPDTEVVIEADSDLLQQVILNLLHNALAAVEKNGRIEMGVQCEDETTRLWVADNGSGMSAADKARMFDPFFTTKKSGTGLGLAVVHQIISQHGAKLAVKTGRGQGCVVTIIFDGSCEG